MTIKSFRTKATKAADAILAAGSDDLAAIEAALAAHFPHGPGALSKAEEAFRADLDANGADAANSLLSGAIPAARDLLSLVLSNIQVLERFVDLHVPQMEDGNNFGVTVQMTVAKFLKDTREELGKKLDAIPAYYASRADAVDKLGLAKTTSSRTKTETESNSAGGKDGDESKKSTTVSTEEKETAQAKADYHRSQAVLAIDVQCYADLHSTLQSLLTGYVCVLDNMEKNESKLRAPKGSSNSMGMY